VRRLLRLSSLVFALAGLAACGPGGVERLAADFPAHKRELEPIREQMLRAFESERAASLVIVGSEYGPQFNLIDESSLEGNEARREIERRGLTGVLETLDKLHFANAGVDRFDGLEVWISTNGAVAYLWRENGRPPANHRHRIQPIRDEPGWFAANY